MSLSQKPWDGTARLWAGAALMSVLLAGCAAERPAWLQQEDAACFQQRGFEDEIPSYLWGDPVHDPCWRWRSVLGLGR